MVPRGRVPPNRWRGGARYGRRVEEPSVESTFNAVVGDLDYPMFIVTAAVGEERDGCLVGFASQSSVKPPRFIVLLSDKNRTYRVATHASVLAVHPVPADAMDLAELFGSQTGDEVDKFERCGWRPGPEGVPILSACPNWFAGRVLERIPAGDHVAFLLEPIAAERERPTAQLRFSRAKWMEPGHDV